MYFNMRKFRVEDLEFFCDKHLDNTNIYSVILVTTSVDFDLIIADFLSIIKSYTNFQIIQEICQDCVRFSLCSDFNCSLFAKFLDTIITDLSLKYKCQIKIL